MEGRPVPVMRRGPGNYVYSYFDTGYGLRHNKWRCSSTDSRERLDIGDVRKQWCLAQLLLWGVTEKRVLEKKGKAEMISMTWDALNWGKVGLWGFSTILSLTIIQFERIPAGIKLSSAQCATSMTGKMLTLCIQAREGCGHSNINR
jgi:hypothetical protein